MSADNALIVLQDVQPDGTDKWNAYMVFASSIPTREELLAEKPMASFGSLKEAQDWAAEEMGREYYEYGAHVVPNHQPFPPPSLVEEKQEDSEEVQNAVINAAGFMKLQPHVGHKVVCVGYGENNLNIAIECEDCNETLIDYDNPA